MNKVEKDKNRTIDFLTEILEDMYDNNEFVEFKLYFMSSDFDPSVKYINVDNTISHFNKFEINVLNNAYLEFSRDDVLKE